MDQAELSRRRRVLVLAICCMSLFIVGIDVTIVNVALPSIQRDLHAPVSGLQWTVDAYTIVVASFLMLSGSTGRPDRPAADLPDRPGAVHARLAAVQPGARPGLAGGVPRCCRRSAGRCSTRWRCRSSRTRSPTRPSGPARSGCGAACSASAWRSARWSGAPWSTSVGWRGIFWVNIPVGVAAIILTALFVPESRAPRARRVDPVGQVLVIIAAGVAHLRRSSRAPSSGWTSARILSCFGLAAAALIGLVVLRAAARRAAARPEVLPQRAVLRRDRDRGVRVRRARRLPVPEHAVPAGRARLLGAARRAVHAADGRDDRAARAAVRPHRRPPGGRGCRWSWQASRPPRAGSC